MKYERTIRLSLIATMALTVGGSVVAQTPEKPAKPAMTPLPLQALLLQIENHVRLEQAAAESFIDYPSAALLHSKTASPFVN